MFQYYYTMEDSLYSQENLNQYKEDIRNSLCKNIVNSIELKKYKEKNIAFQYIYIYRESKKRSLMYTFTSQDYNK